VCNSPQAKLTDFFGTALEGPPPASEDLLDMAEGLGGLVLALDLPSGVFVGTAKLLRHEAKAMPGKSAVPEDTRGCLCEGSPLLIDEDRRSMAESRVEATTRWCSCFVGPEVVVVVVIVVVLLVEVVACLRICVGVAVFMRAVLSAPGDSGRLSLGIFGVLSSLTRSFDLNSMARVGRTQMGGGEGARAKLGGGQD
jgi:hypothetical protein